MAVAFFYVGCDGGDLGVHGGEEGALLVGVVGGDGWDGGRVGVGNGWVGGEEGGAGCVGGGWRLCVDAEADGEEGGGGRG